jgi:hypothetical protein
MNAPKKIWVDEPDVFIKPSMDSDIPYIRADLVDELVEALNYCKQKIGYMTTHGEWYSPGRAIEKADSALAKLEDSHD